MNETVLFRLSLLFVFSIKISTYSGKFLIVRNWIYIFQEIVEKGKQWYEKNLH